MKIFIALPLDSSMENKVIIIFIIIRWFKFWIFLLYNIFIKCKKEIYVKLYAKKKNFIASPQRGWLKFPTVKIFSFIFARVELFEREFGQSLTVSVPLCTSLFLSVRLGDGAPLFGRYFSGGGERAGVVGSSQLAVTRCLPRQRGA